MQNAYKIILYFVREFFSGRNSYLLALFECNAYEFRQFQLPAKTCGFKFKNKFAVMFFLNKFNNKSHRENVKW